MGQKQLDENIVTDIAAAIFNGIISGRNKALEKAMRSDPEFQKIAAEVERTKKNINTWVERELKKDDRLAGRLKAIRGF